MTQSKKTAIIIGGGPAGLTAAYELLTRTDYIPVVLEATDMVGGISRTVNYKGNRMDIGGHRFFSKSDRVMNWWLSFLPLQEFKNQDAVQISYHRMNRELNPDQSGVNPDEQDRVMLIRNRLSRIFYLRKFFDYPIRINASTIKKLGLWRVLSIGISYLFIRIFPIKKENNLEDFFINRFGKVLYQTFFKDYTEKVWGVPCSEIKPEWGSQRVKGLSVSKAIWHALRSIVPRENSVRQKEVETSLIDRFLYPKFGPGQLWEEVTREIVEKGGEVLYNHPVVGMDRAGNSISKVHARDLKSNKINHYEADIVFSTMPVRDLINGINPAPPDRITELANGLVYRDFIAVGLLLNKMQGDKDLLNDKHFVPDNWIYIQEGDVKVGRIQVFNNWSPYMVNDPDKVWLGLEYFCNEGDEIWSLDEDKMLKLAMDELVKIGLANDADFLDGVVVRMPKTYPAYFGTYEHFGEIRSYTDTITNLYLVGRNGMHKYNNQDHSMLTAMTAVDNIVSQNEDRANIWAVNTEEDYHEENS